MVDKVDVNTNIGVDELMEKAVPVITDGIGQKSSMFNTLGKEGMKQSKVASDLKKQGGTMASPFG